VLTAILTLISGIAWTVVYIEAIRLGFRDRTYAMPIVALCLNIAWESTYAIHDLMISPSLQAYVNLIWAIADLGIVYTYLRFGRSELPGFVSRSRFISWSVLIFGAAYAIQWLFIAQFGIYWAPRYAAFLQNLLMSGLFIAMFVSRGGKRGQSLIIAVAKWLGTLAPTLLIGLLQHSPFILGLGLLCCVFDLVYIWLLIGAKKITA
jgi:hypothetical protein